MAFQRLLHNIVRLAQYGQGIGCAGRPDAITDRAVLQYCKQVLPSPVIFDAGANRGRFLHLALTELGDGHSGMHAFEPSRAAFSELQQRFGAQSGVKLNNFALGSEAGERPLYYDKAGSELSSLYARQVGHHGTPFTGSELVRVRTLDEYCGAQAVQRIGLLKLDVEGHELEVLKGAVQMFEREAIDLVSFEFGGCNVDSRTFLRDFFDFFTAHDMQLARATAVGGLHRIPHYEEGLEQFRTTGFLATRRG